MPCRTPSTDFEMHILPKYDVLQKALLTKVDFFKSPMIQVSFQAHRKLVQFIPNSKAKKKGYKRHQFHLDVIFKEN